MFRRNDHTDQHEEPVPVIEHDPIGTIQQLDMELNPGGVAVFVVLELGPVPDAVSLDLIVAHSPLMQSPVFSRAG